MKNVSSLKALRTSNNLTQAELSELSGISVRTIQRIEKGLSKGNPHTVRTLSKVLNVDHAQLLADSQETTDSSEDLSKVKLINFSILSVLFIPFGNLILPALIYRRNKANTIVNRIGRKIVGFQIVSTPLLFLATAMIFMTVGRGNGAIPIPVFICYALYISVSILVVVLTSIHLDSEKDAPDFFPDVLQYFN